MSSLAREITPVNIEEELKSSCLDYAMSVIVGRALPDVRNGLKPVHRRVLYAISVLGSGWNKAYKKSARVVGDIIGKYHPHGDTAAYDTIVRMAQPFSSHYMLVDSQGNFGSVDDDSAATIRYTEICTSRTAHELMADLEEETVDLVDNYDGTEQIPNIMPTKIPNLLVNDSFGIAAGMATNIPPHNLTEVISGCLTYIDDEGISIEGLMEHIPGPDLPTTAVINGRRGIEEAYCTGHDKVYIHARAEVGADAKTGRETIIVHEIPYQVNKAHLIGKTTELVKDKHVGGISALRDESDKDGIRIVIEVGHDAVREVVLNSLYSQTQLQVPFGINMIVLYRGQPKIMNLKDIIAASARHRREVIAHHTIFELHKACGRAHILEALTIALANVDLIIELIRRAPIPTETEATLVTHSWELGNVSVMLEHVGGDAARPEWLEPEFSMRGGQYYLTEQQVQATLDLRLQKLTDLEHEKLLDEYKGLLGQIAELLHILGSTDHLMEVIREEMELIRGQLGDARRTKITVNNADISIKDLISQENIVVTLSHRGCVKYQPLTDYEAQCRGGKGKSAARIKGEDFIDHLLVANTYDTILCFSSRGRLYRIKVYRLPEANHGVRERPTANLLSLEANERITVVLPIRECKRGVNVFMATASGTVKKAALTKSSRPRSAGIIAVNLNEGDELIDVGLASGSDETMLFSAAGKVMRFREDVVRAMGRIVIGVRGIKLAEKDSVASLIVPRGESAILIVTQNGCDKHAAVEEYPIESRATQGVISIRVTGRNGSVVGAVQVENTDQVMMITDADTLVRTRISETSVVGRNTQGVILIRTAEGGSVVDLQHVAEPVDDEELDSIDGSAAKGDEDIAPEAESDGDATADDADE